MPAKGPLQSVQVFGRKKTATAVAHCKRGNGLIKVNGRPLEMVEPATLQYKLLEPVLLLGKERFAGVDIRVRVKGGGHVAQIYAIRQAISKALVAYYQKCKYNDWAQCHNSCVVENACCKCFNVRSVVFYKLVFCISGQ